LLREFPGPAEQKALDFRNAEEKLITSNLKTDPSHSTWSPEARASRSAARKQVSPLPRRIDWRRFLQTILPCLIAGLLTTGCSTFHREWKQAAAQGEPRDDITGRWQGAWNSQATGHHGTLRCVVTKESPEKYRFLYRATWKKILHGTYTVWQDVEKAGDVFRMRGGADLGRLYGGRYEYKGEATPTRFLSNYRAAKDHGTFEMSRPPDD
jgi:hypothetical protein